MSILAHALMRLAALPLAVLALVLAVAGVGCGDDKNKLTGSVSEVYPLAFDDVQISIQGAYLVVEYVKGAGKVVKLSVSNENLEVQKGQEIDLTMPVSNGLRGTLQRIVETTIELPMMTGRLTLQSVPKSGEELTGSFRTVLANPMGRTLSGEFSARVR